MGTNKGNNCEQCQRDSALEGVAYAILIQSFSNSVPANVFKVIESLPVRQKTLVTPRGIEPRFSG
jgi:hypothetical protein